MSQIISWLSLPPLASYKPSGLHLRPHTSYLWPSNRHIRLFYILISLCRIIESREPLLSMFGPFHASEPILPRCWPLKVLMHCDVSTSHSWIYLLEVPIASLLSLSSSCWWCWQLALGRQATEVTITSSSSVSNKRLVSPVFPCHRYTV